MQWSLRLLESLTPPKGVNSGVAGQKMAKEPTPWESDSRNCLTSSIFGQSAPPQWIRISARRRPRRLGLYFSLREESPRLASWASFPAPFPRCRESLVTAFRVPTSIRTSFSSAIVIQIIWLASRASSRNCGQWTKSKSTIGYTAAVSYFDFHIWGCVDKGRTYF